MNETPNYYSITPANVRYSEDLSAQEKLLYSEITALTNYKGYCWATNNYFATLYKLSKETVSRQISKLAKYGFIYVEMIYFENSNQIKERRIYLSESDMKHSKENINTPIDENINTPIDENVNTPIDENVNTPIDENVKDNIFIGFEKKKLNNKSYNKSNPIISNQEKEGKIQEKKTEKIRGDKRIESENGQKNKESFKNAHANDSNNTFIEPSYRYNISEVEELIKENIEYEYLIDNNPYTDKEMIDGVLQVIVSTIITEFKDGYVSMGEESIPAEVVKSVFFKLTRVEIEYFIENFNRQTKPTTKLNAYIRTSLYRNHRTNPLYWTNRVHVDMPQLATKKIKNQCEE